LHGRVAAEQSKSRAWGIRPIIPISAHSLIVLIRWPDDQEPCNFGLIVALPLALHKTRNRVFPESSAASFLYRIYTTSEQSDITMRFLDLSIALLASAATLGVAADTGLNIEVTHKVECDRKSKKGDNIAVHYTGTLKDGTVFDSSHNRNQPITFVLGAGRVIKG
jgi:hypothetical protein